MRLIRVSHLVVVGLAAGVLTWIASSTFDPAGTALRLTGWFPVGLLVLAGAVVVSGWPVRRLTRAVARERREPPGGQGAGVRDGPLGLDPTAAELAASAVSAVRPSDLHRVDPLRAARVLALARASAFVGAACTGAYTALALLTAPTAVVEPRVERLVVALVSVAAAVVVTVAGVAVERWCRLPGDGSGRRRDP